MEFTLCLKSNSIRIVQKIKGKIERLQISVGYQSRYRVLMVQNKEEEIKFFDKFVKNKNGYRPLSKLSYKKTIF